MSLYNENEETAVELDTERYNTNFDSNPENIVDLAENEIYYLGIDDQQQHQTSYYDPDDPFDCRNSYCSTCTSEEGSESG